MKNKTVYFVFSLFLILFSFSFYNDQNDDSGDVNAIAEKRREKRRRRTKGRRGKRRKPNYTIEGWMTEEGYESKNSEDEDSVTGGTESEESGEEDAEEKRRGRRCPEGTIKKVKRKYGKIKVRCIPSVEKEPQVKIGTYSNEWMSRKYLSLTKKRISGNYEAEIERIKRDVPRAKAVLEKVEEDMYPNLKDMRFVDQRTPLAHLVALGRALEVKEAFKDTHYVFLHGQQSELMIVNLLARRLEEAFREETPPGTYKLRHPVFTKHLEDRSPTYYEHDCNQRPPSEDPLPEDSTETPGDYKHSTALISAGAHFASTEYKESPNYFMRNPNVTLPPIPHLLAEQLRDEDYNLSEKDIKELIGEIDWENTPYDRTHPYRSLVGEPGKVLRLIESIPPHLRKRGTLYVICIPKPAFNRVAYVAGHFGLTYKPKENLKNRTVRDLNIKRAHDVLNESQEDNMELFDALKTMPQVRIVTKRMVKEPGVAVFQEGSLPYYSVVMPIDRRIRKIAFIKLLEMWDDKKDLLTQIKEILKRLERRKQQVREEE